MRLMLMVFSSFKLTAVPIIIINDFNNFEIGNYHHLQTKWWNVAVDVGFVSTRAISIFRAEKLYIFINKCKKFCQKPNQ